MKMKLALLGLAVMLFAVNPAFAAGMFQGFPNAVAPFTGNETIPADTGLTAGLNPATELVTLPQLKSYVFGNVGDTAKGTATATGTTTATATLNAGRGTVTSASLTTAAAGTYVLTLTNSSIAATSIVLASVGNGTATTGIANVATVTPGAGSVVITIQNIAAAAALNGTIAISYVVVN